MAKVLVCGHEVSEFDFQSRFYVNFRTYTIRKGMNNIIPPPSYRLNNATVVLLHGWFWQLITCKGLYATKPNLLTTQVSKTFQYFGNVKHNLAPPNIVNESPWSVRCQSARYSPDLSLWLCVRSWNPRLWALLALFHRQGFCNVSEISWTIGLRYYDHLGLCLSHKCLLLPWFYVPDLEYIHLSGFLITHRMNQCTTCQRTNYQDTSYHNG